MSSFKSDKDHGMLSGAERGTDRRHETTHVDHDRRKMADRRHMQFGVKFSTPGSLISLEDWLDANCSEPWKLVLLDMDSDLDRKDIQIMFTSEADKNKFVAHYSSQR